MLTQALEKAKCVHARFMSISTPVLPAYTLKIRYFRKDVATSMGSNSLKRKIWSRRCSYVAKSARNALTVTLSYVPELTLRGSMVSTSVFGVARCI
jgi:hypothetical protein